MQPDDLYITVKPVEEIYIYIYIYFFLGGGEGRVGGGCQGGCERRSDWGWVGWGASGWDVNGEVKLL